MKVKLEDIELKRGIPINVMGMGLYFIEENSPKYRGEINSISPTKVMLHNGRGVDNSLLKFSYKIGPIQTEDKE